MTSAAGKEIGYNLPSNVPRPIGAAQGDIPSQSTKDELKLFYVGTKLEWPRTAFGTAVGDKLSLDYDAVLGEIVPQIDGPIESYVDRTFVQYSINTVPTVGNVVPQWFWWDAARNIGSGGINGISAFFGRINAVVNAIFPNKTKGSDTRRVTGAIGNASTSINVVTSTAYVGAPGTLYATVSPTIVSEDGTTSYSYQMKIAVWVGARGNPGVVGQFIPGGGVTTSFAGLVPTFGKPTAPPMTVTTASRLIDVSSSTGYINSYKRVTIVYNMANYGAVGSYNDYTCVHPKNAHFATKIQTARVSCFFIAREDGWYVFVSIMWVIKDQVAGTLALQNDFFSSPATEKSALTVSTHFEGDWTKLPENTTTTITKNLFAASEATFTLTVTMSSIGLVTKCESKITPNVAIVAPTTTGAGWRDKFSGSTL